MATKDLGNKHLCTSCGAKFYDMGNLPPTCPKCETVVEAVIKPKPTRAAPKPAEPAPSKKPKKVVDDDAEDDTENDVDDAPLTTKDDKDDANVLVGDKDRKN